MVPWSDTFSIPGLHYTIDATVNVLTYPLAFADFFLGDDDTTGLFITVLDADGEGLFIAVLATEGAGLVTGALETEGACLFNGAVETEGA